MSAVGGRVAEPIWFGSEERPLHGWLHRPDQNVARGGVVICPPVGIDLSHTYTNLLLLARALTHAGFLVVRFDYDGTGQSAGGMGDSDRLDSWIESIRAAVDIAREAGVAWLGGVGLRLGATLLARAAAMDGAFSSLALWDPYSSGTAFLREQTAVKLGVLPQLSESVPGLAAPGYVFSPETVEELQGLEIASADELRAECVLALTDPARRTDKRLKQKLGEESPMEWQEYCQVSDLYDTGRLDYLTPRAVVEQVATWVAGSCTGNPVRSCNRSHATRAWSSRSQTTAYRPSRNTASLVPSASSGSRPWRARRAPTGRPFFS